MVFQYAVVKKAWLDIHYHARSLEKFEKNEISVAVAEKVASLPARECRSNETAVLKHLQQSKM